MNKLREAILKTLAYSDIFDYPLKLSEIERYLVSPQIVGRKKIRKELEEGLEGEIGKKRGYYFLSGRQEIVELRIERKKYSLPKKKQALKAAQRVKKTPWLKGVILTGALSRENAVQDDDIDWLIITAPGRLWLARSLIVAVLELKGCRRRPGQRQFKDKICLNMFLSQDNLGLSKKQRSLFTAYEIVQAQPLWQKEEIYKVFVKKNRWIKKYLANAYVKTMSPWTEARKKPRIRRRRQSWFLRAGMAGVNFFEKLAFCFQLAYMRKRKTREIVEPNRAFFHPQDRGERVMKEYRKRLENLKLT